MSYAGGREFESQRPAKSYANSLRVSAWYGEYNEKFGFGLFKKLIIGSKITLWFSF